MKAAVVMKNRTKQEQRGKWKSFPSELLTVVPLEAAGVGGIFKFFFLLFCPSLNVNECAVEQCLRWEKRGGETASSVKGLPCIHKNPRGIYGTRV